MNWNILDNENKLEQIKEESKDKPVLIFKHSTRCSISGTSLNRVERKWNHDDDKKVTPYLLDLISFRNISNKIASEFGVDHQSPQVLLIKDGVCVYDASHFDINKDKIVSAASDNV